MKSVYFRVCFLFYLGLGLVYALGLFQPLLEGDSTLHASMAMRMYLNDDFLNIYKNGLPYLDKPHLHFWLAAFSFKLFGLNAWAYRLPALLFLGLGAWATYRLYVLLFKNTIYGHVAALAYLSAQTLVLSGIDVRTDAILTGTTILSLWMLVSFFKTERWWHLVLGGIFTGLAFSSKGLIAVVVIGFYLLAFIFGEKAWHKLFRLSTVSIGLLSFMLAISPVLVAYYVQYDMHPELMVDGQKEISGIKFILWDQSFNRLQGKGFGKVSTDYSFFFHTLLWAFLPFSLLFYIGMFKKTSQLVRRKEPNGAWFMLIIGFWTVMLLISFSKFKLPHYINSIVPMLGLFSAAFFQEVFSENIEQKNLRRIQLFVLALGSIVILALQGLSFQSPHKILVGFTFVFFAVLWIFLFSRRTDFEKIIFGSVAFAVFVNIYLNGQFYPALEKYTVGRKMAALIEDKHIPKEKIWILDNNYAWSLDIALGHNIPTVYPNRLTEVKGDYLLINASDLSLVKVPYQKVLEVDKYRISKLKLKFLNPKTRKGVLEKTFLLKL